MESITFKVAVFTALIVAGLISGASGSVECYVCSYSPNDANLTDTCTPDNFKADYVITVKCDKGCENVEKKDPNNELEQYHRNCYTGNNTKPECTEDTASHRTISRCMCMRDFCNGASLSSLSFTVVVFALFASFGVLSGNWRGHR